MECRDGDEAARALLAVLDHAPTAACTSAERAMTRILGGSCRVPIAAYATLKGDKLSLEGLVGDAKTGKTVRGYASGPASDGSLPSIASAAFFRMLVRTWPTCRRSQVRATGTSGRHEV